MIQTLQGQLEELERELLETNGNAERLARSYNELVELQLVLERAGSFFDETRGRASAAAFESRPAAPDGVASLAGRASSLCCSSLLYYSEDVPTNCRGVNHNIQPRLRALCRNY